MSWHARNLRRLLSWRDTLQWQGAHFDAFTLTDCRIRETAAYLIGETL